MIGETFFARLIFISNHLFDEYIRFSNYDINFDLRTDVEAIYVAT